MKDLTINLVAELEVKYVPKRGRKPYGEIRTSNDAFKVLYPLFNPDTIRLQEQFVVLYLTFLRQTTNLLVFVLEHLLFSELTRLEFVQLSPSNTTIF
jgi:hypothetical protein